MSARIGRSCVYLTTWSITYLRLIGPGNINFYLVLERKADEAEAALKQWEVEADEPTPEAVDQMVRDFCAARGIAYDPNR